MTVRDFSPRSGSTSCCCFVNRGYFLSKRRIWSDQENLVRKAEFLESIQNGSVVTWRHINLHGEYDFSEEKTQDTVGLQNPRIVEARMGAEKRV